MVVLWALQDGLNICLSKNFPTVEVELDAKIVINALTNPHLTYLNDSPLMEDCRQLAHRFNQIRFKHCYCEAKMCADGLAKKGASQVVDFFIFNSPPMDSNFIFILDLKGLCLARHCCELSNIFLP